MGTTHSAKKRHRQNLIRNARNKIVRTKFRNAVKDVLTAESGEKAQEALRTAQSSLDKAASKGVIHRNTASRRTGRLARRAHRVGSSPK